MTEPKAKHTSGPWGLDYELPPNPRSIIARTTGGLPISGNTVGPHDPASDEPNARLIATASDLLEACKYLSSDLRAVLALYVPKQHRECWQKDINMAASLIAKAG